MARENIKVDVEKLEALYYGTSAKELRSAPVEKGEEMRWLSAGLCDSSDRAMCLPDELELSPVRNLFSRIKALRRMDYKPGEQRAMWPIQDLVTDLVVPLPRLSGPPRGPLVPPPGHVNLHPLLAEPGYVVFEDKNAPLNTVTLKKCLEELRIPVTLRSAFLQVYTAFAKALSDSLLFDNVLDAYDLFASVHRLITKEMAGKLDTRNSANLVGWREESERLSSLNDQEIKEMTEVVRLLEDVLRVRVEIGFRRARHWQDAIESRGGYSRLVNAADVPTKLGMNVLRRVMEGQAEEVFKPRGEREASELQFRARVGGACRMSYDVSAVTRRFNLGDPSINFIADLSFNIAHLTKPTFVYAHIHETGHLLCDLIRGGADYPNGSYCTESCRGQKCLRLRSAVLVNGEDLRKRVRFEEVFAEMFTFGLVFGRNGLHLAKDYVRRYLALYFLDPVSSDPIPQCLWNAIRKH